MSPKVPDGTAENGTHDGCQCPDCQIVLHFSDCSVHNEPAFPRGECDCGAVRALPHLATAWEEGRIVGWDHCRDGYYGNDWWDDSTPNPYATTGTTAPNTDLTALMTNHSEARYAYASPDGKSGVRADLHGHPRDGVTHSHPHDGAHDHDGRLPQRHQPEEGDSGSPIDRKAEA